MTRRGASTLLAFACLLAVGSADVRSAAAARWLTGSAADQQLQRPLELTWVNRPLGASLESLSAAEHLAIVLDRRVDPNRKIELTVAGEPLSAALQKIAELEQLGVSVLGGVVYFGPAEDATKLRTLAHLRHAELEALPPARRKALSEVRTWRWEELTTPRELIEDLAQQAHLSVRGLDELPHDLWAARELPPLSWTDRLSLVLIQFGRTFQVAGDGKSVELLPIPESVTARRSFPAGKQGSQTVAAWSRRFPAAAIRLAGDKVVVEGRIEELEALAKGPAPPPKTPRKTTTPGKQVYKLTVEKPLRDLLADLGKKLELDFQFDPAALEKAGISLDQIVTVKVENASLDELIDALLAPAGLTGKRRGGIVTVTPAR